MTKLLMIALGGSFGALLRYVLSATAEHLTRHVDFPYGTLTVNILGCLLIGGLGAWGELREVFSPDVRALIFIGFLGAFTTFSTFSAEAIAILNSDSGQALLKSSAYVGLHLLLGLGAVVVSSQVVRWVLQRAGG